MAIPKSFGEYVKYIQECLSRVGNLAEQMYKVLTVSNELSLLRLIPQENYDFSLLQLKISILKDISNKHLLPYTDIFQVNKHIALVYEFHQCETLQSYMKNAGFLAEDIVKKFLKQILKGLHFLHSQGLIHGNLNSSKIVVTAEGKAKIFDYGMLQTVFNEFSSPESRQGKELDESNDIWSLGVTVVEMLTGEAKLAKDFCGGLFSAEIQDFVTVCMHPTPQLRPSTKDLLQHGFFSLRDSFFKHRRCEAYSSSQAELILSPNGLVMKSPQLEASTNSKGFQDSFSILTLDEHSQIVESIDLHSPYLSQNLLNLLNSIKENPDLKDSVSTQLVKLKEVVELFQDNEIIRLALQIITTLSDKSHELLEKICVIGLLAAILPLAGEENPRETRVEVAYLIGQMFKYDDLGKMCLAAGGLEILPRLLDADYEENRDLVLIALDCMLPLSKNNDNLRVWGNNGTAERLVITFSSMIKDDPSYLNKVAELIFAYAKGPKAEFLCIPDVLELFLFSLKEVSDEILILALKTIQALIPNFHNALENSGCTVDFISFLKRSPEVQEVSLICLVQYCELSLARYEQFCILGGLESLIEIIDSGQSLDLAIEIISALPSVSNASRAVLRQEKTIKTLIKLLFDDRIVESLCKWIKTDPFIEPDILDPEVLDAIGTKISQETRLIKWEGVLESSYNIKKNLYEIVKRKGGNQRVLELIKQELNRS